MTQAYPPGRCAHCDKVLAAPSDPFEAYSRHLQWCSDCDEIDPMKLPINLAWIDSQLRPPK
jgi:phage FluMu protein Com